MTFSGPGPYGGTPPGRSGPGFGPGVSPQQGPFQPYPGVAQPYSAAQPFGPAQQAAHGYTPGQYPPGPPPKRGGGGLWLALGIGAGLVVLVVTFVFVLVSGDDDGSSPTKDPVAAGSDTPAQNHEAFVREFIVNSSTFSPGNTSRYEQAIDTYCDDSPDKSDARNGLAVLDELQVSSQTDGTPSVEVMSGEASGSRIPVHYSVKVTTRAGVTSKSGTLTGTVYVRPGADRCVIEVVEDESGPTQTF